jgi:hypothetical protein
VITSLTSGWRGAACRRGLVTAAGNSAEGIPRGNIRGGRDSQVARKLWYYFLNVQ